MVHVEVRPGDWIMVPVPGEPFPVHMQIGDGEPEAAFLDHVPYGAGVRTVAQRRCPNLLPKRYRVVVTWPGGSVMASVTVIG